MKAVFLDFKSVDRDDLDVTALHQSHSDWTLHDETFHNETAERINHAEIVVTNKVPINRYLIENSPHLKLICVAATGTNNIDLQAAKENDVTVTNVTAYGTPSVVQHVFALMFALATRLPDYTRLVAGGAWQKSRQFCLLDYPISELAGKTLGIIGYGELGRAVAQAATAFGMKVLVAQHGNTAVQGRIPLDELLAVTVERITGTASPELAARVRDVVDRDLGAQDQLDPDLPGLVVGVVEGVAAGELALADEDHLVVRLAQGEDVQRARVALFSHGLLVRVGVPVARRVRGVDLVDHHDAFVGLRRNPPTKPLGLPEELSMGCRIEQINPQWILVGLVHPC